MSDLFSMSYEDATAEAHDRDPRTFRWGYFSYSDAAPPFGGGVGAFMWFSSFEESVRFFVDMDLPHNWFRNDPPENATEFLESVRTRFSRPELTDAEKASALTDLNKALEGLVQMEWWGTFDDLLSDTSKFPRKVRRHFRDDEGEKDDPITDGELDAFVEYLSQYGF